MRHLNLVKPLSLLKEEFSHTDELHLDSFGLSFTRGTLIEIGGAPSSGKTSLLLSILSKLTSVGEICALVDSTGGFDPCSAFLAGVELENLLWVRCGGDIEKAFMAADYLVQAKGFGAVWLNLSCLPKHQLRFVPRNYWYRYRTRVKETPTLFLVTTEEPIVGSASQQSFLFSRKPAEWFGTGRFKLLKELRSRLISRKQFYEPMAAEIKFDYTNV